MWMPAKTRVAKKGDVQTVDHANADISVHVCVSVSVSQLRNDVQKNHGTDKLHKSECVCVSVCLQSWFQAARST